MTKHGILGVPYFWAKPYGVSHRIHHPVAQAMCRFGGGDDASYLGESLVVLHHNADESKPF